MARLFGTDGIRGQANSYPIVPEVALQLGKAIAHEFGAEAGARQRALIGKDTRLSGYMLETALTAGLVSMGMDVFLVGPIPTPSVAHLTRSMNADVGIMLTASHNPFDDNGIKIFDREGFKLSDDLEHRIEEHVLEGDLVTDHIRSDRLGKAQRIDDARGRYIEFAKSTIDNQSLAGIKLVLDCANGAAYQIGPWIFKELGAEVIKAGVEPDGFNINEQCGAVYPARIGELVKQHGADLGIAFDGDADRVVFCDHRGREVDGDRVLAMCAPDLQSSGRLHGDTVVVTLMSNLGLDRALKEKGIQVVRTDVGDRYVIEEMRAGGYRLGGEQSGHIIFMDHATTGDGIIGALQVLKLMKNKDRSLAELASCLTEYPQRKANLPVKEKLPLEQLKGLQSAIRECEAALAGRGRVLVRYSGTEPKIRLLVEAENAVLADHWMGKLREAVGRELG